MDGQILMRAYLSGTPECKFGLNDKLVLDKTCVFTTRSSLYLRNRYSTPGNAKRFPRLD